MIPPTRSRLAASVAGLLALSALPSAHADTAYVWGSIDGYQTLPSPTLVTALSVDVSTIASGIGYYFGLHNGTIYGWGSNGDGQLGNGNTYDSVATVTTLSNVSAITAGWRHTLAIQNGALYTWGYNADGQLGDGTTTSRSLPGAIASLSSNVTAIAAGDYHSLALQNGTVYAWGNNQAGQLGYAAPQYFFYSLSTTPAPVPSLPPNVTAIAAGDTHSLALQNGTVYAWGWNGDGQLGDGTTTDRITAASVMGLPPGITTIAAGYSHNLALLNGEVYAWGGNYQGQLGDGTTTNRLTPIRVPGLSNITAIAANDADSYALAADGSLWSWGWNRYGQIGNGTVGGFVSTPTHLFAPAGYKFTAIAGAAGSDAILATVAPIPEPASLTLATLLLPTLLRRRRPFH